MVATVRALPASASGDIAFGLEDADVTAAVEARLEALGRALSDLERAG